MSNGAGDKPRVLLDYLKLATGFLADKGIESSRLDAEVLLASVLAVSRMDLYTSYDRPLAADEVDRFRSSMRRRSGGEPTAYITGSREFWSLDFSVDRRVLVPRPETEHLIEWALEIVGADDGGDDGSDATRILDLGTGSGAIAVALASELTKAVIVAADCSAAALEVAPSNARRHGVASRISFVQSDLFAALRDQAEFDLIVSNPPYVSDDEYRGLARDVRDWEPRLALLGGGDGLSVIRPIIEGAPQMLASNGRLLVEVGSGAAEVASLMEKRGFVEVEVRPDLAGHDRIVGGKWCADAPTDEAAKG